jgi:hypothetical protein
VLEQESQSQGIHDTKGDNILELEYIEEDDSCTPFTFGSIRDYPGTQPKTTGVRFDDLEPS